MKYYSKNMLKYYNFLQIYFLKSLFLECFFIKYHHASLSINHKLF